MKSINQIMSHGFVKYLLFPILLFLFFFKVAKKPNYNWDVVFYVGTLFNSSDKPIAESRLEMINTFEKTKYIDYDVIYPKTKYGEDVFFIDKVYQEQFAFYDIRVLYNLITKILYNLGIEPVLAVYINSCIAGFLCVLVTYLFILFKINNTLFAFLIGVLITLQSSFINFMTSSPDSLSALMLLLFIISFIEKRFIALIFISLLAIMVRTDNIIFIGLMYLSYSLYHFKNKNIFYRGLGSLILCTILYYILNLKYGNAGYRVLYYHTFIENQSYPLSLAKKVSIGRLFKDYLYNLPILIYPLVVIGFVYIFNSCITKIKSNYLLILLVLNLCITFTIKFLMFPSKDARFLFQYFIFGLLIVIYYFRKEIKSKINVIDY